jgi:hypothetical protein
MSLELKRFLFDAYGGFADKRVTRVERGNTFIIDDRKPEDSTGRGALSKTFCRIFARVVGEDQIVLSLHENAPIDYAVRKLVESRGGRTGEHFGATYLSVTIHATESKYVRQLAQAIEAMVDDATDLPQSTLQRTCTRVASSLHRYADCLVEYCATHPVEPPVLADGRRLLGDNRIMVGANGLMPAGATAGNVNIDTGSLERQIARLSDVIRQAEQVFRNMSTAAPMAPRRFRNERKEVKNEAQDAVLKEILRSNLKLRDQLTNGAKADGTVDAKADGKADGRVDGRADGKSPAPAPVAASA